MRALIYISLTHRSSLGSVNAFPSRNQVLYFNSFILPVFPRLSALPGLTSLDLRPPCPIKGLLP
jgi:hypothetical protein